MSLLQLSLLNFLELAEHGINVMKRNLHLKTTRK